MKLFNILLFTGLLLSLNIFSQTQKDEVIKLANEQNTESFFKHLKTLSDDAFEGRETGSKGYALAADYVVTEIQKLGLKPGGDNGTFFQTIEFESRQIEKESVSLTFINGDDKLEADFGKEMTFLPTIKASNVKRTEELVFVGYGLEIPELGINDFQGIDVKGKTIVIAIGLPDNIDKKKYKSYINPIERIAALEKKGVSGIVFYTNLGILQNILFNQLNKFFQQPWFDYKDLDMSNPMVSFNNKPLVYGKKDFIKDLFRFNGLSFKETLKSMNSGQFKAFPIKSGFKIEYKTKTKFLPCKNIAAILPGTDPVMGTEYLILESHLDHLGIGKAVKKDSIYNGTWDNASGCATLLSVAEAYTKMSVPSKRSIMFVWVTAEEKGLLGSNYFAIKPTVPREKIVADMSLDMAGGIFEAKDILPMGYKMSNLSQAVDFATANLNLGADTTSSLENEYFERSDHFSFVKAGIPSLLLFGGMNAVDPKIDGLKTYKKWEKKVYHSPADDMNQKLSKEAFLQGIKVNFLISWYIANELGEVKWKKESYQYKKYIAKK